MDTMTRAELSQAVNMALAGALPEVRQELTVLVDPDAVLVLAAMVLELPVLASQAKAQCGRFVLVDYAPVGANDPDVMLYLGTGTAAEHFHACIRAFQRERSRPARQSVDPGEWLKQHGLPAVRLLASSLWALQPTKAEASFVLRWALVTVCNYRIIF